MKLFLLLPILILAACGSKDSEGDQGKAGPALTETPETSMDAPPLAGKPGTLAGSPTFVGAAEWVEEEPSNGVRMKQYRLPGASPAADAVVAVTFWKPGVGDLEANIQRWIDQVGGGVSAADLTPKQRWMTEPNGFLVTCVHVEGAIKSTEGMASDVTGTGNDAIFASFIEKPGSASVWVVKATGPAATVAKHREALEAFIAGI